MVSTYRCRLFCQKDLSPKDNWYERTQIYPLFEGLDETNTRRFLEDSGFETIYGCEKCYYTVNGAVLHDDILYGGDL